jgi:hypothetical protein
MRILKDELNLKRSKNPNKFTTTDKKGYEMAVSDKKIVVWKDNSGKVHAYEE